MSDSKEEKKKRSKVEDEEEDDKETKDEESEPEGTGEGEEEEYLPADEKKKRESNSPKKGKEVVEEGNAEYDDKMEADRCKRFDFLLKQTEIFGHFMQESGERGRRTSCFVF